MLGLGLGKFGKGVKSGIAKLLSSLKRRAEYFENKNDSKSEIKVLKDYELLDKATILLTPTATSDARVHSVKTYTGDELVTNGDFANWTGDSPDNYLVLNEDANNYVTESNGQLRMVSDDSATIAIRPQPTTMLSAGSTYRVSVDLTFTTGTLNISGVEFNTSGTKVFYLTPPSTYLQLAKGSALDVLIDNLSIVDVSSDFDFDRASSATRINSSGLVQDMQSITDPELVLNGDFEELGNQIVNISSLSGDNWTADGSGGFTNNGSGEGLSGSLDVSTIVGETYKFTFDVTISGIANATFGGFTIPIFTTSGSKEYYVTATSSSTSFSFYLAPSGSPSMFVNNISVKQVNVDSEGNNIWSLSASGDSSALITDKLTLTCDDGDFVGASQSYSFVDGNTYRVSFDLTGDNQSKTFTFRDNGSALGGLTEDISLDFEGTETKTFIFTANANSDSIYTKRNSAGTYSWSIDNVSVKDITFSTDVDLARINYDSNGENGHILLEPTSTNLITYSEDIDSLNDGDGEVAVNSTLTYESDVVAPDGSLGVYRIQNPATASTYLKVTNNTTAAQSMSVWVKAKTVGTNNQFTLYRDGTGSSVSDVKTATGEWQRFEYSWSTVGSGAYFINNDGDTYISDLYVWGIQVENLPYTTSYIPNHGTAAGVTRAAETLNGSGNSTLINTTQGTIYLESKLGGTTGTKLFSIGAGTNNADPAVLVGYSGSNMYFDFIDGSSLVDSPDIRFVSGINTDSYNKMAVSYTSTSVTVFLNGVKKVTKSGVDFTPTNSLKALYAGYGVGSKFEGEVKTVAVFNEAFEDDELELLTGVTNYNSFNELASANGYTII